MLVFLLCMVVKMYDGLQVQNMGGKEGWINFAKNKNGYIFRPVYDPESDAYHYDGYVAIEGNKEQIDNEDVPFIFETGSLQDDATSCMVLFIKKGDRLTKQRMWEAILDRRKVAVLEQGKMMGPQLYRNTLQMLLLDRIFLEEYFGDRIDMEAVVEDYNLIVTITNTYSHSVSGTLEITLPYELKLDGKLSSTIILPSQSTKNLKFKIRLGPDAMDKMNPIAVHFNWGSKKKSTLTMMDMPRVISVHQLLYGHAPGVTYPVTIHNFSKDSSFPVQLQVVKKTSPMKLSMKQPGYVPQIPANFRICRLSWNLPPVIITLKFLHWGLRILVSWVLENRKGNRMCMKMT